MPAAYSSIGTVNATQPSPTPGTPALLANGDGVLVSVTVKPDTATVATPSGWTLVGTVSGGGGSAGNGTGPTVQYQFFREKDSTWTTVPQFVVTGGTAAAAVASRWTKAGNEAWSVAMATGVYGTGGTTTNASTTMGSNPGITSGDMLAMFVTNQSSTPTWSAQSMTATGATIGAATERSEAVEYGTNPTVGGMLATAQCTAGTATANPVANATASAATRGTSAIVRLRATVQPFYPAMDASAPATIKSTTGSSFTTDSFDCPANIVIVVGLTSDADSNAGAAPTIADSTGAGAASAFTWTLVDGQGYGGVGDTGVVALFQGVLKSPGTAPGPMTITVTPNNNGTTKPRMIRTSVYPSTAVDISDPIGAVVKGAFGTGTAMSASLTPETTGGALRMMWLDWNATGVPTTTQPNTGVADSYHNAGLSTNIQLAKTTGTTAGVAETIGATLLASATDGNYLAYELRAPGTSTPAGAASGGYALTGAAATGAVTRSGANTSGAYDLSLGAAAGAVTRSGVAATSNLAWADGPAVGAKTPVGTHTAAYALDRAAATGAVARAGSSSGAYAFSVGSTTGTRPSEGLSTSAYDESRAAATGAVALSGATTGGYDLSGSAVGLSPLITPTGQATGSYDLSTASAVGAVDRSGGSSGAYALTGSASGQRTTSGSSFSTYALTDAGASGATTPVGSVTSTLAWDSSTLGAQPRAGQATGAYQVNGIAATGDNAGGGTAGGGYDLSGSGAGSTARSGVAVASTLAWTLQSAIGTRGSNGQATSAYQLSLAVAAGSRSSDGVAAGVVAWSTALAVGSAALGQGASTSSYHFSGGAVGARSADSSASSTYAVDGFAAGQVTHSGSAGGTLALTSVNTLGATTPAGSVVSILEFAGVVTGGGPGGSASGTLELTGAAAGVAPPQLIQPSMSLYELTRRRSLEERIRREAPWWA